MALPRRIEEVNSRLNKPTREKIVSYKDLNLGTISTKGRIYEMGKGLVTDKAFISGMLYGIDAKRGPGRPKSKFVEPYKEFDKYIAGYTAVPIVAAAIDRTVDFAVSPGFYVLSESEKAKKIVEDFIEEMDFDLFLRNVVKDMLIFGDSFVEILGNPVQELKVLNPTHMRVFRTKTGTVTGYCQDLGWGKNNPHWSEKQIAHFIHNRVGDSAYGTSLIEPLLTILNIKVEMERAMKQIVKRKAGAPIHVKMGSDEFPANQTDIEDMATDLQHLTNSTEWVTGHTTEMEVVGFRSKIIDIEPFTEHIDNQCVYGLQVPFVLLGKGRIPEGLARVQLEAMDRRAKSIQLLVEHQLEKKIFSKLTPEKVEFQWGSPSQEMFTDELTEYLNMLQSPMSNKTKVEIENKIRKLLQMDGEVTEDEYEKDTEKEPEAPFQKFKQTKKKEKPLRGKK